MLLLCTTTTALKQNIFLNYDKINENGKELNPEKTSSENETCDSTKKGENMAM